MNGKHACVMHTLKWWLTEASATLSPGYKLVCVEGSCFDISSRFHISSLDRLRCNSVSKGLEVPCLEWTRFVSSWVLPHLCHQGVLYKVVQMRDMRRDFDRFTCRNHSNLISVISPLVKNSVAHEMVTSLDSNILTRAPRACLIVQAHFSGEDSHGYRILPCCTVWWCTASNKNSTEENRKIPEIAEIFMRHSMLHDTRQLLSGIMHSIG